MNYKGYEIEIKKNPKDEKHPYIAIAKRGYEVIEKKGYDEQQATNLVKGLIDFTTANEELNKKGFKTL